MTRRGPVLRLLGPLLLSALAAGVGVASLLLQGHEAEAEAAGADLSLLGRLAADGSTARTAWVGWAAALAFGVSTVRVLRGPPEPPVARDPHRLSVGQMRAALRREHRVVAMAMRCVLAVALLDGGRALVYGAAAVGGSAVATGSVAAVVVEAAGLVAAAAVLAVWVRAFRRQLETLGALESPPRPGA